MSMLVIEIDTLTGAPKSFDVISGGPNEPEARPNKLDMWPLR